MSQLTPNKNYHLKTILDSASGVESTAKILQHMIEEGRIEINDSILNERYLCGLLSGQIALSHLIQQSLESIGME